jgi:FtsX extracellular domain
MSGREAEFVGARAPAPPVGWWPRLAWLKRLLALALRGHRAPFGGLAVGFLVAAVSLRSGLAVWRMDAATGGDSRAAQLVAFLRDELPETGRRALAEALRGLPGIATVRLLGSDEALARMRTELGSRASVLDGVEEGFLPATLEISVRPGSDSGRRADALAWRLRRMDGVADVDLLRSPMDEELVAAKRRADTLRIVGLTGSGLLVLVALLASFRWMRQTRADAVLLASMGFAVRAVVFPVALLAAGAALLGTLFGIGLWSVVTWLGAAPWNPELAPVASPAPASVWGPLAGGPHGPTLLLAVAVLVGLGGCLGWWGARPSERELETLSQD